MKLPGSRRKSVRRPRRLRSPGCARSPFIIPIIGARTVAQLDDNLGCLNVAQLGEHMARLEKSSAIELGFPHEFLAGDVIRTMKFAGAASRIDAPPPKSRV